MTPTQQIIDKAVRVASSPFTKEVLPCTKLNAKSFVVSVVNERGGEGHLIDYTFNTKTGKLNYTKLVESKMV